MTRQSKRSPSAKQKYGKIDIKKLFGRQILEMGSKYSKLTYLEIDGHYTYVRSISLWEVTGLLNTHLHSMEDQGKLSLPVLRKV